MLADDKDILEEDLYALLEVDSSSSTTEIKRAWRRTATKCHPDRHPDNPKLAALFLKITKVLDILSDPVQRRLYDEKKKANVYREKKRQEMDSNTKRMRDELHQREEKAKRQKRAEEDSKINLEQEIAKLREEGLRKIREQQEKDRKKNENRKIFREDRIQRTVRVGWDLREGYTEDKIKRIFSGYGKVEHVVMGKSGKSAVVLFETVGPALSCEQAMKNHPLYNLDVCLASKGGSLDDAYGPPPSTAPSHEAILKAHTDFEKSVLEQLRQHQRQREERPPPQKQEEPPQRREERPPPQTQEEQPLPQQQEELPPPQKREERPLPQQQEECPLSPQPQPGAE